MRKKHRKLKTTQTFFGEKRGFIALLYFLQTSQYIMSMKSKSLLFMSLIVSTGLIVSYQRKQKRKRKIDAQHDSSNTEDGTLSTNDDWSNHLPSHIRREQAKEMRRQKKMHLLAMKGLMYDNITMLCPKGTELSKISAKKAAWYVKKGLASYYNSDRNKKDDCIKLHFEPKKRSEKNCYSKANKENICVACGSQQHPMRFHIIPYVYRTLFPREYKSHMSHDVVLLCGHCHLKCGQVAQERMKSIEQTFHPKERFKHDERLYKVRSAALALLNWKQKIPEAKLVQLENVIMDFVEEMGWLDKESITSESINKESILQKCIDIEYRVENTDYIPGAQLVVESLKTEEDFSNFIRQWRQSFLDSIHLRYLPKGWDINNRIRSD
jgi:hypothetical protein